jgi:hypothetical protein
VSCASQKLVTPAAAERIYTSPLFTAARAYAKSRFEQWYILSAKYGLLHPRTVIEPYNVTLRNLTPGARAMWAKRVSSALVPTLRRDDSVAFVAGELYRKDLQGPVRDHARAVVIPLEGFSIGKQLQWLTRLAKSETRLSHLDEFYTLLERLSDGLGGTRVLQDCNGAMHWPKMGVYFFFEPGEYRASRIVQSRVVRVGTHAVSANAKSTLWHRLLTHKGTESSGGNHRGSIFRLHVGAAVARKLQGKRHPPTWGIGQVASPETRAAEAELEALVSAHIGSMPLLWLAVEDPPGPASDRAYLERNAIALLSSRGWAIDIPSASWLGRYSPQEVIASSGLWNLNHVGSDYDPRFLEVLARYVDVTLGRGRRPERSIAPAGWSRTRPCGPGVKQLTIAGMEDDRAKQG